ncbi:hypothetical protein D9615_005790 [Tricholomella constricta]|uniref:Uncharacterized protein n=1 Tax=Tricholomella constricta TaxID=117010 RepID=A0A8H5HAT9_9AGAR|nr:hypothetical protein D9615_005790 [Tricholomella constricta]
MSDEYASSGYKGSLVNPSKHFNIYPPVPTTYRTTPQGMVDSEAPTTTRSGQAEAASGRTWVRRQSESDYNTHNYPPEGDSTSSGGYGSPLNVWSDRVQRGNVNINVNGSGSGGGGGRRGPHVYRPRRATLDNSRLERGGLPLRDQFDDSELGREINARREFERQRRAAEMARARRLHLQEREREREREQEQEQRRRNEMGFEQNEDDGEF